MREPSQIWRLTIAHDATGDPGDYLAALEQAITDAGVVVTRLADLGGAHGYSQPGRITILESLTPADTAAVLVHEFAHELLHQRGDDRPTSKTVRETEAEAVAFIVGAAIGIRSSVDATDYIQLYDGERGHAASIAASDPGDRKDDPQRAAARDADGCIK